MSFKKVREGRENVGTAQPHVAIIGDHPDESTKLFECGGRLDGQNCINLLAPWFDTMRC